MTEEQPEQSTAERYDQTYEATTGSPLLARLWKEVYGDDYPEDAELLSFTTIPELDRMAEGLRIGTGATLVDLACGRGGPGLWVSRMTGADLVGIDISSVALERARCLVDQFGRRGHAEFRLGEFAATGLEDGSADGAMSVDALQLLPDRSAALREVARILKPGGRFAFTTWEILPRDSSSPDDGTPSVESSDERTADKDPEAQRRPAFEPRSLLEETGFRVDVYEEPAGWRGRQLEAMRRLREAAHQLREEVGAAVAGRLLEEAEATPRFIDSCNRVLAVAERVGP